MKQDNSFNPIWALAFMGLLVVGVLAFELLKAKPG